MALSALQRDEDRKAYFAKTNYRGKEQIFGIKAKDRLKHFYVIGKTGMGKSVLLENIAIQDIRSGNGIAFLDPHGASAERLLEYVPEERINDVIYLAPFDMDYPVSFNVMEDVGYDKRHLVSSNLISAFKKIWPDVWSSRMEYILQNALLALLEYPDATLLSVNRMLIDKDFRKNVVAHITDPIIKSFWVDEFAKYTDKYTQEATPAIQNKIGQFVSNPVIRNVIGQPKSSFDMRTLMDQRKILIMNLSKGRMGDTNSRLLGSMLIIKMYLSAMSRADVSATGLTELPPYYFFVDEFQAFANETFSDILSEARKYKLSLTIAHQYIGQMPDEVRDAIFGNVGTLVTFRIGAEDAEMLEKEFTPTFIAEDMVSLGAYQIYLKLMIDGLTSKPFSAMTLPPLEKPEVSYAARVIEETRKKYAVPRSAVEEAIRKGQEPIVPAASTAASAAERAPRERVRETDSPRSFRGRTGETSRRPFRKESPPAPKAGHTSFKDAVTVALNEAVPTPTVQPPSPSKIAEQTPPRQPKPAAAVPLSFLKSNREKPNGLKREHLNDLRAALSAAMDGSREEKPAEKKQAQVPPPRGNEERQKAGAAPQEEARREPPVPPEIPRIPDEELRAMLRVEGEEKR